MDYRAGELLIEGNNYTVCNKRRFSAYASILKEDKDLAFEFAFNMSYGNKGAHRNHRSGGSEKRSKGQIFINAFQGKLAEYAVYRFFEQHKIIVKEPDVTEFGLGIWDAFDLEILGQHISIKSTKARGDLLLLEEQDWNKNGEYIPNIENGNSKYDFTILVRFDPDGEQLMKENSLLYQRDEYPPNIKELLIEIIRDKEWRYDFPGFITYAEMIGMINEKHIIPRGALLNGHTKMDATNYYYQTGNMHPLLTDYTMITGNKGDGNSFLDTYASHLNEKQLQAVQAVEGPVLLLAVPGSGKTTVLVNRLGYMIFCKGINPDNILALTYNKVAITDMSRRFTSIFGEENSGLVEFRTINGICQKIILRYANMIGKPAFSLCDDEKVLGKVLADILVKKLSEYPTESDVKGAKTLITYCKNMMLTDDEIEQIGNDEGVPLLDIYKEYNQYLRAHELMDYDDQMVYAYRMLKGSPELLQYYRDTYKYICVDEAQDTSKVQHIIIGMLAGQNGNLFMVGDEDQSIYGFRAAYPEALLNFEKDHPLAQVLVMDQNYRSNAKIVSAADIFIQHNKDRHKKHMVSTRVAESDINYIGLNSRTNQYNYLVKLARDCKRETAVLYRDNESVLPLIDQLDRQSISYRIKSVDMAFFTHRIVVDVTNILKFALNPSDADLFMRIYFKCQTFLKKNQAEEMCRISSEKGIPILSAVAYMDGINGMVKGKCRALQTNLGSMKKENPGKALFRIENPMGYGEYLERNNIDDNRLFILKQLANNEVSIMSFLSRLEYLQNKLKNNQPNYDSKFILSTIHSSKGLEYDAVYLMDVCDGVFPNQVVRNSASSTPQERKNFEEERRLFYVGMTRAKNELNIFKYSDKSSCFLKDLESPKKQVEKKQIISSGSKPVYSAVPMNTDKEVITSDFDLIIGERVVQIKYGSGTVSDVTYSADGKAERFDVAFDSGEEKTFVFPIAFKTGMRLESGEIVLLNVEKKVVEIKKTVPVKKKAFRSAEKTITHLGKKNTYAFWASAYPDHVVIKHEGAFWTCRGESAETLNEILGYKLGGNPSNPVTGSPSLDPIVEGLNHNAVSYIVVEDGEIIEKRDY